ncbi:hypothetical protein [Gynuella sunshinyii]|uniref:Uncharacterized protein n=1 Tax=Gynuella sunshinyii YC6258 TaxID=1445510 RepID=A0A0C5VKP0_9GAMM|nr:hypothetical protein [Gynuella sunshinyii]AJQ94856.1 hypothetical Protein YC6258_02818 [Gynuella sunshinyii YC6258]
MDVKETVISTSEVKKNLNEWKFYSLICTLLFLSGLVAGRFFSFNGDQLEKALKVISIISSLATIFGVLVAYLAFSSWKIQYKNAKLDLLIDNLEDAFNNLGQSIGQYYYSTLGVAKHHENAGTSVSYEVLRNKQDNSRLNWFETQSIYEAKFSKLTRHLNFTGIEVIEPPYIESQAVKLFQEAHSVYKSDDVHESDRRLTQNGNLLADLFKNGASGFEKLREKVLLTKRSTAD